MWKLLIWGVLVGLFFTLPVLAGHAPVPQSLDPGELGEFFGRVFHYYSILIQTALGHR